MVKALSLDKDYRERKPIVEQFSIKKNFNHPRHSKMDFDEDIVHCIAFFCQESYKWNKFQEHVFICKHNKESSKTQEAFDAELENLASEAISIYRPLEPT